MNKSPEAIFDVFYLGKNIQDRLNDFNISEIQSMAYLSCLISLYDKNPISFWKYQFIKSENSSPYSLHIHSSVDFLKQNGYIEETTSYYFKLSDKGLNQLSFFDTLSSFNVRKKYLDIVCKSLSIIPLNLIKASIKEEPIMKSAFHSTGKRILLDTDTPAMKALYSEFSSLYSALGSEYSYNLLAPAIVWLQSLSKRNVAYDS